MLSLYCPHCATMDTPVLTPGPSAHALTATCAHCHTVIKTVPRALVRPAGLARARDPMRTGVPYVYGRRGLDLGATR
jgi:hypothetical protein